MPIGIRNYAIVTAAYWAFTLTDGALRMLVLLHFFKLGYSPFTLAFLFLLYEFAGIVANLSGGWLATRFGIPRMLAGVELALYFYEINGGAATKVSMRSTRDIDAGALARTFGGGGHRQAAGCSFDLPLDAAKAVFLPAAERLF